jgi:3-oxoacyl-[acyl-carrier protein] reductase
MKNILIIGGSKGVGKELVQLLSKENNNCHVISRSPLDYNFTGNHYQLNALTDELPAIETLDGIVYCIGSINLKPFNRLSMDDFNNDLQVNYLGAVKILQQYLAALKKSENASVVLFSTVAVKSGMPYHASISGAKGAVEGLTKSLAAELAPKIRVNAVAPSIVNSPLAAGILRSEQIIENMVQKHPLKRILQPIDVAKTAHFLVSDASMGITGQIILQDNGLVSLDY